jgi:uncharacterized protein YdiU (UPF0061 family)
LVITAMHDRMKFITDFFIILFSLTWYSSEVLRDILDMDPDQMSKDPDFVEWVSGNKVLDGSIPMAHRYGGHQFGSWVRTHDTLILCKTSPTPVVLNLF